MAIRERKGRKSSWQVYWNNPFSGKRESQDFLTRKEAEKEDSLVKHRLKFDRESFKKVENEAEAEAESEHNTMTLETCYLMYLKQKQFSKKSLTKQLNCMRPALNMFGCFSVASIIKKDVQKLMESMLATRIKPVTVRTRLSVFRTVLRWASSQGMAPLIDFPTLPAAHYEKFVPPTPEEISMILRNAPSHIFRVVVIGSQLGARVGESELFRLTWDDVDIGRKVFRIHGAKKNLQTPWREVPIRENLLPFFEQWRSEDLKKRLPYLVHWGGKPVARIKGAWKSVLKRAGITRRIRPYDLRHAFATEMIAAGTDIGTVAKLMGHNSPAMIFAHYQHVMDRQKRAAVESLPDIGYVPKVMCPENKAVNVMP